MAIIPQQMLFSWEKDVDQLGDLERLQLVFETLPDEPLMRVLEKERGKGRDDYPIRAMWHTYLSCLLLIHRSDASMLRELTRNVQLRYLCGYTSLLEVPKSHNYSRFKKTLLRHKKDVKEIFAELSRLLYEEIPDFGKATALDSKNIDSFASRENKNKTRDGRRDLDAQWGKKVYKGIGKDGKPWEKVTKCFGYKVHLLVDSDYELPIHYQVTPANTPDVNQGYDMLHQLDNTKSRYILERMDYMTADKAYDSVDFQNLVREKEITPIIDTRKMWRVETEKEVPGYPNVYYNESGEVFCYSPIKGTRHCMANDGYEKKRKCLRKKCPAQAYGISCGEQEHCSVRGVVRIPLQTDERIFTEVDRSSYKWKRLYSARTSVERVNSRLDFQLGFEQHTIRGLEKMDLEVCCALICMNTLALGRHRQNRDDLMRSLTKTG